MTLTSGGNDLIDGGKAFLRNRHLAVIESAIQIALQNNWQLVQHIQHLQYELRTNGQIYLLNMYNPFPNLPEADHGIQRYNYHIDQLTPLPSVRIVDIYSVFRGRTPYLLSRDGVHPNNEGYELIADTLMHYSPNNLIKHNKKKRPEGAQVVEKVFGAFFTPFNFIKSPRYLRGREHAQEQALMPATVQNIKKIANHLAKLTGR